MTLITLKDSGESDNRVDIVFMGDGYTASEIPTAYREHIDGLVEYLFSASPLTSPFFQYRNFFNVHYVDVVSNESGTDDPINDILKDTALDSTFNFDGVTDRLLSVDSSKARATLEDALVGTGIDAEIKFISVNTEKYGGAGGQFSVFSGGNTSAFEVALHELGHSFAGLADEYSTGGPTIYEGVEPNAPNSTINPDGTKWERWLGHIDPDLGFSDSELGTVGVFEGSSYSQQGAYRPTLASKMRTLDQPFGPIAKEAFVLQFYEHVDPLDDWTGNGETTILRNPELLNVVAIDDNVIDIEWRVDGVVVGNDQTLLDLTSLTLANGNHQITARAYDNTGRVRIDFDKVEQTISWDVDINYLSLIAGTSGADTLLGDSGANTIDGLAGDDFMSAGAGYDTLIGGEGNDTLIGGTSANDLRDLIFGGDGNDLIDGGYGNDELRGDAGHDTIAGGFGTDTVIGGTGDDVLTGSALGDKLFGGDGGDFVNGGFGFDRINGGGGADEFFHLGIANHGSDWIQDYDAAEGDVLVFGNQNATRSQFQINATTTPTAGLDDVEEAFIIFRPTGQIMWALVDGDGQDEINLQIGGDVFDLMA